MYSSLCFQMDLFTFIDWIFLFYYRFDLFFMPLLWLCKSVSNLALVQNDMSCHGLLICPPGYNHALTQPDKHDFPLTFASQVFCLNPGKSSAVAAAGQ